MWREFSAGLLKNNRSSCFSIRLAALISALLLSLLCGLFYNAWKYEVERIEREEGGWQSRVIGVLDEKKIESIRSFAAVKEAVVNEEESRGTKIAVDLYFDDYGAVLSDTPPA